MMQAARRLRVVLAPDSYKESLSASEVAAAMAEGVASAAPNAEIIQVPMADGGEGSLDAVLAATGGERRIATVRDANGHDWLAAWGWLGQDTAFIEMAEAAGLERIAPDARNALRASTYGVGQLVLQALDAGASRIVMGLGGSATTDGGSGLFQALGARLYDAEGGELPPGGGPLHRLAGIDIANLDPRLTRTRFEIAVDVDNVLTGAMGAPAVFGPQKGASPAEVAFLDKALSHFAAICMQVSGRDESQTPGTGAAGGLGYIIKTFFEAEFRPGVELIADLVGLDKALEGADLVITGEGRLDRQTLLGKTPAGVARHAAKHGAAVICLAGSLGPGYESLYEQAGVVSAFSVVSGPMTLSEACKQAPVLLRERSRDCLRLWLAARAATR